LVNLPEEIFGRVERMAKVMVIRQVAIKTIAGMVKFG